MSLTLNKGELSMISYGTQRLTSVYPYLFMDRSLYTQMLGLQFTLASADSFGLTSSQVRDAKTALCKLRHDNPGRIPYVVESSAAELFAVYPQLKALCNKYRASYGRTGVGNWSNITNEQVINAVCQPEFNTGYPIVVHRPTLTTLISQYGRQEDDSTAAAAELPKASMRERLADEFIGTSANDRKMAASEGAGRCYCCGAPKRRRISCVVCGYTPRGGR